MHITRQHSGYGTEYMAMENGMIVATVRTEGGHPHLWIEDGFTEARHRRKGYMRFLVRHLIENTEHAIRVLVRHGDEAANQLFEGLGFTDVPMAQKATQIKHVREMMYSRNAPGSDH